MNINLTTGTPLKTTEAINRIFSDPKLNVPLAFAIRIPRTTKDIEKSLVYLGRDIELNQDFNDTTVKDIMKIMNRLYLYEDIYSRVVDLWISFGATHLSISDTTNEEFNKIVEYWSKHINEENQMTLRGISQLKRLIFRQVINLGNCFPYENWKQVEIDGKFYRLPTKITCLNPSSIDIDEFSAQYGEEKLSLVLKQDFFNMKKNQSLLPIKRLLTKRKIQDFMSNKNGELKIPLNSKLITHLKRSGDHHTPWGIPFGTRALNAITDLHRKRLMDGNLIQSMIKRILHFKIGNDEFPCTDSGRMQRFKTLLADPEQSMVLVTPHDVTHEDISPDMEVLGMDKYEHDVMRVLVALGAPPALLGLEGSKNPEIEVSAFAESLRDIQEIVSTYFEIILEKIAIQNDLSVEPTVKMGMVNVNKGQYVNMMREIYYTGNISHRTFLDKIDIDYETEKKRREDENKDGINELFTPPKQPFQGNSTDNTKQDNTKQDEMTTKELRKDQKQKMKKKFASVEDQISDMGDLGAEFYSLENTLKAFCKMFNVYYDDQKIFNIRDMFENNFVNNKGAFASTIREAILGE